MTESTTREVPLGVQLTPLNPEYQKDPFSLLDAVREADRVIWDEQFGRWIVGRFEDVQAILRDPELLVDPRKANEKSFNAMFRQRMLGDDGEPSMLFQDPPNHTRLRGLVSKAFTPRAIERMQPRIEEIAHELCDRVEGQHSFDLMAAFCQPYPTIVIAEMLGVDPKDQADFKRWTDDSVAAGFDPFASDEVREKAMQAGQELDAYLRRVIAERRAEPRDDLITGMLKAEENGDFLNDEEVLRMIGLLLAAGNVTTTDLLGNGMKNLLQHPEQAQLLRERPELIENAVEEMLRYEGPVTFSGRIVPDDRVIAGCPMHKGDSITVALGAANYDPRLHKDPHAFDVTREDIDHVAFGGGRRYCLGAPLARLEAQIGVRVLLERFPTMRLAPQELKWKRVPGFRGLVSLIVEV
ncbi:cytochrome P450 [Tepidiforma sp.]|uniref:cytochrome P450 n=1 Tax=Tepidiforma sp. TaxID=2682230 RepID=UPI002ADD5FA0|nr:cytochrome P450 [Tepidiforma sp.]